MHVHFEKTIKMLRSDNGAEFFSKECKDFLSSFGVLHQSSCPYTPQQNGVVERRHRHILEVARALRFQGSIQLHFWGDCVLTVVYLINRIPSSILGSKSPYEVFHKSKPSLLHLRVYAAYVMPQSQRKLTNSHLELWQQFTWDIQALRRTIGCMISRPSNFL